MSEIPAVTLPLNPDYGRGKFFRSLQLTSQQGSVRLAMEDTHHSFEMAFEHDGQVVTDVRVQWARYPMNTCTGSADALKEMVGCPLSGDLLATAAYADKRQHCTHLFDMLCIGIAHAWHRREDRRYDIIVPDAPDGQTDACLQINGETVLRLALKDHHIAAPEKYDGISFLRGFTGWAKRNLSDTEFEYAFIIQRGFFVSLARRLDFSQSAGKSGSLSGPAPGVCYTAQAHRYEGSIRLDNEREFSEKEELLRFFGPQT